MARARNILILVLCFFKFLRGGKAKRPIANPNVILIVQLAQLGDMVCTTPMFEAVKVKFPKSKLTVLGKPANEGLLKGHPYIDEYISFKGNFFETLSYLKKKNIDFATTANPNFFALALSYLSGAKTITAPEVIGGYSPYETISYKLLRTLVIKVPHRMGHYAPREYLNLFLPLAINTSNTKKTLAQSPAAVEKINKFFEDNKIERGELIAGIAPGAGNKIKLWGAEKFAEVAKYLSNRHHARIIILGAAGDKEEADKMISFLKKETFFIDTTGKLSIEELKALVAKLSLVISVDSGPIYIAEAFGIPTIDILGPMGEDEQPPISDIHRVVYWKGRNAPSIHIMNTRVYDAEEVKKQTEQISVKEVTSVFEELKSHIKI